MCWAGPACKLCNQDCSMACLTHAEPSGLIRAALSGVNSKSSYGNTDDPRSGTRLLAAHITDLLCGLQGSPDLRHDTSDMGWPLPD